MNKNRKKTEEFIIGIIDKLVSGSDNKQLYIDLFKRMNDKEFHSYMEKLRNGKQIISIFVPNYSDSKLSLERNLNVGKSLGIEFFQQVYMTTEDGDVEYLSPQKNLVYHMPCRRTAQHLLKGISVPDDSKKRNPITNQVTGSSAGGKITMPEVQVLNGLGMKHILKELMTTRGGDVGESNAMRAYIHKYGMVRKADVERFATGTGSTKTLKSFLRASHIDMKGSG